MLWFNQRKPGAGATTQTALAEPGLESGRPAVPASVAMLFERDLELGRLLDMWQRTKEGHGTVVLVAGEAGIGKSSVLSRFFETVSAEPGQHRLARASCYAQTGRDEPFWPFADVMKQLVGSPSRTEDVLDAVLDIAPSWAAIVPVAGDIVGAGIKTAQVVRDRTRGSGPNPDKLLREYADALAKVARERPVLIIIDDLHWSDDGSVRLLSHLARTVPEHRVMIVSAFRPSDIAVEGHLLLSLIDELVRYNDEAKIDLPPLSVEGVGALVRGRYPANKIPDTVIEDLHRRTGGAPLFVVESLRLMESRGELRRDDADGRWTVTRELSDDDLPPSVEAVVRKRIDRLPPELRHALVMAAVQGPVFETAVLASVLDADELGVLDLMATAEHPHDIVTYVGDVEVGDELTSRFRFTNTLFQLALVETLRGKQYVNAHRRTAEGIEQLWGADADAYAAQLALHYERGRLWRKSAEYLVMAAQRARRSGETATGIRRFEHAEQLLRRADGGATMEQQIEIDEGLSYLYDVDSRYDEAEARIQHALALNVMTPTLDWGRSTMLNLRLADLTADKGRVADAQRLLQDMYDELLGEHRDEALSLEAYRLRASLALALTRVGKDEEGIQLANESLASLASVPHGVRDPDDEDSWRGVELELRGALAASYFGRGRYQLAIETSSSVLKDAEAMRMLELALLVRHRLSELNLALGRYDEVERHVDAMIATARQLSNETGEAMAHVVRAKGLRLRDDPAGALAELEVASRLVAGIDWYVNQPQLLAIRAACLVSLGRLPEADELLDEASDAAGSSGVPEWVAAVRLVHASLLLARGDADAAADEAADAARTFEQEWAYFEQAQALRLQAQAHLEAGNRGTAAYFFSQAAAVFDRIGNTEQSQRTLASADEATVAA